MFYYFTNDCLIGVEQIDKEHRELFRIINDISDLLDNEIVEDKYDRSRILLERLESYAEEHFRHEEEYMESICHPELELQKQQHLFFCDKINQADMSVAAADQQVFLDDLLKYLVTWLYRHIISCDLMIGKLNTCEKPETVNLFIDAYLTGIGLIDDEHRELFRIIGETQQIINDELVTDKYDQIVYLLEELKNYTKFHFADEENYMESIRYEGLSAQKKAHEVFISRLEEIDLNDADNRQQEVLEELIAFLTEWLINHILHSDKKIAMARPADAD